MRKIRTIGIVLALMVVVFSGLPAMAADANFKYKDGPKGGLLRTILYYEVTRDYTIDLNEYFSHINKLPGGYVKWDRTEEQRLLLLEQINGFPSIKWDFIELEAGTLTVKKGYRWDGASTPWNNLNIANNRAKYIRCSCIHDAIYDLMRMEYLQHDKAGNDFNDPGFRNRLIADCLIYMIMREDGRRQYWAQSDFEIIRFGGFGKTHKDKLLAPFKYHVSELTAWASDGKVELRFLPADDALRDPNEYGTKQHIYRILRKEGPAESGSSWQEIARILDDPNNEDWDVVYTDTDVKKGRVYSYQLKSKDKEHRVWWTKRHHDKSNVESVATPIGRGNALWLNNDPMGIFRNFVTADLVSNDLSGASITFEAWVYPEAQDGISAILAFNTPSGGNLNLLMCEYDSEKVQFVYQDSTTGRIYSAEYDPGRWYHVAVAINDSNEGILYVNGIQEATFTTAIRPSRTALFSMGQEWDWDWDGDLTPSNFYKGRIDETRVWTIARAENEIQDGMWYAMRGDETGLIGLWHFDEPGNAFYAYDATPNGNDGSFTTYIGGSLLLPNTRIPHVPSDSMTPFVDPASGLMARYRFDGNAYDDVNHNDGTVVNATLTEDRFGNADSAYDFDGNGDYISLSSVIGFGAGDSSVACWVKIPTGVSGRVGIVLGNYPSAENSTNFEIHDDGQLRIYWNRGILDLYGTTDLRDGLWHHIAFVRDKEENDRFYAYIDGARETLTSHASAGTDLAFTKAHWIGADRRSSGIPYFNGAMDDLRVYERALTIDEIFDLADSDDDGLPDRWELDNGLDPSDIDSDDDGIADGDDAFPMDPSESSDADGDGTGDNADTDDDNDGILDQDDAFPTDPSESSDADGDGTGDNADTDDDNDGISDEEENAHPNGGDGNSDTIPDRLQNNVISLVSYNGGSYITLESPAGTSLSNCQAADNPSSDDAPADIDFSYGFFNFTINGIGPGDSTTLKLYFPADASLETYYKYGQTPDNHTDHWYEFMYDGETGAEIDDTNKTITLHFTDAKRGDDILTQDSMIIDPGGPGATSAGIPPGAPSGGGGGSGGGCFISTV